MATRNFSENYEGLEDITTTLERVNLQAPTENVINKETSAYQLLQLQAETQAKSLSEALDFMQKMLPLQATEDTQGIMGEAGMKVNVQAQREHLKKIAEMNNLATKMIQARQQEKRSKQNYFDEFREPICNIPQQIGQGDQTQVSDSALKLLTTFYGDSDKESENLRTFLRAIFDVALTNKLTTECTAAIIKRKLQGTARRLIDAY